MNLDDFIKKLAELFEETDSSEIKADTVFHDLDEWSSLMGLNVIAMIDEEYGVLLKGDEIKNSKTFADLFEIVKTKKA